MTDRTKSTFARRVRAAKPRPKKHDVWDDEISDLGLRVGTTGHRLFFLRREQRGRVSSATIGNADAMTVPEARCEARKLLATFIEPGVVSPINPSALGRFFPDCSVTEWLGNWFISRNPCVCCLFPRRAFPATRRSRADSNAPI